MPLHVREIDANEYENGLLDLSKAQNEHAHFLQAPFYGLWQQRSGKKVVFFEVRDNESLVSCGLAVRYPLPRNKFYYYCPYGPITKKWSKELAGALRTFFTEISGPNDVFVRFDSLPDGAAPEPLIVPRRAVAATSSLQPRNEWVLDITPTSDELLAATHKNVRYQIRLCQRSNVSVEFLMPDTSSLEMFYKLMEVTSARNEFGIMPKSYYQAVFETLDASNSFVAVAKVEGVVDSVSLCVMYDRQMHYVFACSSNENRRLAPSYLLQWECIKHAKQLGCELYNFGGISDNVKQTHLHGVTKFKQRFGGFEVTHPHPVDLVLKPTLYKLFAGYKTLQKHTKRLKKLRR